MINQLKNYVQNQKKYIYYILSTRKVLSVVYIS